MRVPKVTESREQRLLGLLEERLPRGESVLSRLDALVEETGTPAHADLLRLLTHLSFTNDVARKIWSGFQIHRATLQRRLRRDVGARVAMLDYLSNVEKCLDNPKFIEFAEFDRTEKAAITDGLTGLFNRAHFDVSLKREINRCLRYGQTASLVMMDLDQFKQINDQNGHPAGDRVLKDVGRLLIQRVRDIDIAARYGGEEFAVILPETKRMSAYVVAERVRSEVARYFKRKKIDGHVIQVTISGGVATYPDDATTAEAMIARADEALYRAKEAGRNKVVVYYEEKRRSPRVALDPRAVRVRLDGPAPQASNCRAVNISENGMLLQTNRPLRAGQSLGLRLALARRGELNLEGEVVRLEERRIARNRRIYDAGIKFRFAGGCPPDLSLLVRDTAAAEL